MGEPKPPLRQCRDIAELCLADGLRELQHSTGLGVLGSFPDRCPPLSGNVWGSFEAIRQLPPSWFSRVDGDHLEANVHMSFSCITAH